MVDYINNRIGADYIQYHRNCSIYNNFIMGSIKMGFSDHDCHLATQMVIRN